MAPFGLCLVCGCVAGDGSLSIFCGVSRAGRSCAWTPAEIRQVDQGACVSVLRGRDPVRHLKRNVLVPCALLWACDDQRPLAEVKFMTCRAVMMKALSETDGGNLVRAIPFKFLCDKRPTSTIELPTLRL